MMKKSWFLPLIALFSFFLLFFIFSSRFFWSLPFIPATIKNSLFLNANIFPASDDSRSLFLSVNPHFRAEFGDKEASTAAFIRFEVADNASASATADVEQNQLIKWQKVYQAFQTYQPGIEWQLFATSVDETEFKALNLTTDQEILRLFHNQTSAIISDDQPTEIAQVLSQKQNIVTKTQISRRLGFDLIENLAVAPDIDLTYQINPNQGLVNQIVIGDRQDFDTACLQLLNLGIVSTNCDLPENRFSFLLKLDEGSTLVHSPLSIDQGQQGSYYILRDNQPLLRFANPVMSDAGGATSHDLSFTFTPASLNGQTLNNYYIVTLTGNLNWLLDSQRKFPVRLETGFFIDQLNFFQGESLVN